MKQQLLKGIIILVTATEYTFRRNIKDVEIKNLIDTKLWKVKIKASISLRRHRFLQILIKIFILNYHFPFWEEVFFILNIYLSDGLITLHTSLVYKRTSLEYFSLSQAEGRLSNSLEITTIILRVKVSCWLGVLNKADFKKRSHQ